MPGIEIERKWLVDDAPDGGARRPGERIEQGYLTIGRTAPRRGCVAAATAAF